MRILVIGAGALGGLIGAELTRAGEDVTLLESNVARAKLLGESGLVLSQGTEGETRIALRVVTSVADLQPVDLLFVAVKSYQTESAVRAALPVIAEHTWILSMQNGLGNVEQILRVVKNDRVLTGITFHSIQHTGPNHLRYRTGIKPIQIAPADGRITDEVRAIGTVFRAAGLATDVVESIDAAVWQKLVHNAVVNPVSALTDMTCSELLSDEDMQRLMRGLCAEIIDVMRARGVPLQDEEDPYRPVMESQRALGKNRPSMWQDLQRGFRTEIDAINGGVVAEAERLGISTPLNEAIVLLVHSRERQKQQRKERAARILAEVKAGQEQMVLKPAARSHLGGMPDGRVPLESAPKLKELVHEYYVDLARAGADPQRHVAWCSGCGPAEVVRAFGYTPYFPENNAALLGASRLAAGYIQRALADGFSPFVNSEMVCDVGAMLAGESPIARIHGIDAIPAPEVLVYTTSFGQYLARWFEYYSNRIGAPLLGLHPPSLLDDIEKIDVDSATQQMLRLVDRLEDISGRKLDQDRLAEIVDRSARASSLWRHILDLACHVPAPLTYFDTLIHVAPMLLMRGTEQAVTYYEILVAELEQRIVDDVAAVPGEGVRFYWEGPPVWCALRPLASMFLDRQIAVVGSSWTQAFVLEGLRPDNPIETLSRALMSVFPNRSREYKVRALAEDFSRYATDACIYHDARTSAEHSNARYGLHVRLQRDTGTYPLVFEADTHDLRLVSIEQLQRQLDEYLDHFTSAAADPRARAAEDGSAGASEVIHA